MLEYELTCQRFTLSLSSVALGIWEAARLLSKRETQQEGRRKLERLRKKIEAFGQTPALAESLRICLQKDFRPDEYLRTMDQILRADYATALPAIKDLVRKAQETLNEASRKGSGFPRPV